MIDATALNGANAAAKNMDNPARSGSCRTDALNPEDHFTWNRDSISLNPDTVIKTTLAILDKEKGQEETTEERNK
jgi:hypothetical protein